MDLDGFKNICLSIFDSIPKRMTAWQGRYKGMIAFFIWFDDNSKLIFAHNYLLLDYISKTIGK